MLFNLIFGKTYSVKRAYLLFVLLSLPTILFLNNEPIWDDSIIFAAHNQWSLHQLLMPQHNLAFSYWRPLAIFSIVLPHLLGVPIWCNKLISLLLFLCQGGLAIAIVDRHLKSKQLNSNPVSINALAMLLALHPVFVETSLWICARADLMMGLFVLLGLHWYLTLRYQELGDVPGQGEPNWKGFARGLLIAILVCASKDTGVVWSLAGLLLVLLFSLKSSNTWRKYWRSWAIGTALAMTAYLAARYLAVGHGASVSDQVQQHTSTSIERLRLFSEFVVRAWINIFLPLFDQAPFKSAGWFNDAPLSALLPLLALLVGAAGYGVARIHTRDKTAGWLLLLSLGPILFHGLLVSLFNPFDGSIVSDRYLAPSAMLIYIALALIVVKPTTLACANSISDIKRYSVATAMIFTVMVLQSLAQWSGARLSWDSNLGLWETSWQNGSRSDHVVANYIGALFEQKNFNAARNIGRSWIAAHQNDQDRIALCKTYDITIAADISLKDVNDVSQLAAGAIDIGWCSPTLSRNIAASHAKDHCRPVLAMLERTLAEGLRPPEQARWVFSDQEQLTGALTNIAYSEARCGSDEKLQRWLTALAQSDKDWRPGGSKATQLIKLARADL